MKSVKNIIINNIVDNRQLGYDIFCFLPTSVKSLIQYNGIIIYEIDNIRFMKMGYSFISLLLIKNVIDIIENSEEKINLGFKQLNIII